MSEYRVEREQLEVERVSFIPSFNGCHNRRRALCFIALQFEASRNERGLTRSLLSKISGSSRHSIDDVIPSWLDWHYITEEYMPASDRTIFWPTSKLGEWVNRWCSYFPLLRWTQTMTSQQVSYFFEIPQFRRELELQGKKYAHEHGGPPVGEPPVAEPEPAPETPPAPTPPRRRGPRLPWADMGRIVRGEDS